MPTPRAGETGHLNGVRRHPAAFACSRARTLRETARVVRSMCSALAHSKRNGGSADAERKGQTDADRGRGEVLSRPEAEERRDQVEVRGLFSECGNLFTTEAVL